MTTESILLLMTICFVAMVSPGPDFLLVTRNALSYPRRQAFATAVGIISGCFIHATYCIFGIALLITQSILLFSVIKYAGAAYLIYLGLKGLMSRSEGPSFTGETPGSIPSVREAYLQGLLCNLLNPKLAIFLLSLFTQFVDMNASVAHKSLVAGVFIGESVVYWPILVLLLQSSLVREAFSNSRLFLERLFGGLLIYLGFRVAFSED